MALFDLTSQSNENLNTYSVVHVYNRSDTYHLTKQVLMDCAITQDTWCFFYHILSKSIEEFNITYGSFACLIKKRNAEANLYLNVHSMALEYIVRYIQTGKLYPLFNETDPSAVAEVIDLATIFGMPILVDLMRKI